MAGQLKIILVLFDRSPYLHVVVWIQPPSCFAIIKSAV